MPPKKIAASPMKKVATSPVSSKGKEEAVSKAGDEIQEQMLQEIENLKEEIVGYKAEIVGLKAEMGAIVKDCWAFKDEMKNLKEDLKKHKELTEKMKSKMDETDKELTDNVKPNLKKLKEKIPDVQPTEEEKQRGMIETKEKEKKQMKELKEDLLEDMEVDKRKLNLIVKGVPENKSEDGDYEFVEEMFTNLIGGQKASKVIEDMERMGRYTKDKKRNIRVMISNSEAKRLILTKAKELKNKTGYEKVYVTPDLTRKQQEDDQKSWARLKELREQGRTDVWIQKGKVVKKGEKGKDMEVIYDPRSQGIPGQ